MLPAEERSGCSLLVDLARGLTQIRDWMTSAAEKGERFLDHWQAALYKCTMRCFVGMLGTLKRKFDY